MDPSDKKALLQAKLLYQSKLAKLENEVSDEMRTLKIEIQEEFEKIIKKSNLKDQQDDSHEN